MSEQEIAEIFQALDDVSPLRRSKALEELRVSVKENHGACGTPQCCVGDHSLVHERRRQLICTGALTRLCGMVDVQATYCSAT